MHKRGRGILLVMGAVGWLWAGPALALMPRQGPVFLITAEYTPYSKLMEPEVVGLFQKYGAAVCLCVRAHQLNEELDRLYQVYEQAGVPILFWPLLPLEHGLYLNKRTTRVYLDYLETLFNWAEAHGHRIEAIVIDVEPSYIPPPEGGKPPGLLKNLRRVLKDLDRESFQASLPEFNRINDLIHAHDCLSVAAAFPFVIDDRRVGRHGWEDLTGGPVATIEWDYLAIMMYTSWFVEVGGWLGMDWDSAHYLAYDYSRDLKALWGDRAAVAVGVTNPGQGHEQVLYTSAEQIAPAIAAVRAAGIQNLGIYDLQGILESGDPESWFQVLRDTPAGKPEAGRGPARRLRRFLRAGGWILDRLG